MKNPPAFNLAAAIADAAARSLDPDRKDYPELFKVRTFTNEEVRQHQAHYQIPKANHYPDKPRSIDDAEVGNTGLRITPRYQVVGVHETTINKATLRAAGWNINAGHRKVTQLQPCTWVDTETGEVVTIDRNVKTARLIQKAPPIPDGPTDRALQVATLMQRVGASNRAFVGYVLRMRNRRGGLLEPLRDALDRWIDHAHPKTLQNHRARKRESLKQTLYKFGILADDQTLARAYQRTGFSTKRDNVAEAAYAGAVLGIRAIPGFDLTRKQAVPYWKQLEMSAKARRV